MNARNSLREVFARFASEHPEEFEALRPHVEFPDGPLLESVPENESRAKESEEEKP